MNNLTIWGWNKDWQEKFQQRKMPHGQPGRVMAIYQDKILIQTGAKTLFAQITGRFRHQIKDGIELPVVGDWVLLDSLDSDPAPIHELLPRKSLLTRKAAGSEIKEQPMAANIDVAFVMTSFNEDFNLRRLDRFAVMLKRTGVEPVIIINKSDLALPDDARLSDASEILPNGAVYRTSAYTGEGIDVIKAYLDTGKTGIFLGSSGVGKSTLLNALMGNTSQKTKPIREDDAKGRHTTTTRQLFSLPTGGLIIDTPGIRELQLWVDESVLDDTFTDITQLKSECRFSDCQHETEPGCAVKSAIESGTIAENRLHSYRKLQKELAFLQRKQDPEQRANSKRRWKKIHKTLRADMKTKRPPTPPE